MVQGNEDSRLRVSTALRWAQIADQITSYFKEEEDKKLPNSNIKKWKDRLHHPNMLQVSTQQHYFSTNPPAVSLNPWQAWPTYRPP